MNESEIRAIIRSEVKNLKAEIMMGFVVSNEDSQRSTIKRMSLEGPIGNTRNIQNFGISSRAPANTEALIVPVNGDPTHLNMVGHFDKNKPDVGDGETCLYDANANKIHLLQGKINAISDKINFISSRINIGSEGSAEPLLLGNVVKSLFADILDLIVSHDHFGNLGYPTGQPRNAADFTALKASPVNDGAILSDKAFTEK